MCSNMRGGERYTVHTVPEKRKNNGDEARYFTMKQIYHKIFLLLTQKYLMVLFGILPCLLPLSAIIQSSSGGSHWRTFKTLGGIKRERHD